LNKGSKRSILMVHLINLFFIRVH